MIAFCSLGISKVTEWASEYTLCTINEISCFPKKLSTFIMNKLKQKGKEAD